MRKLKEPKVPLKELQKDLEAVGTAVTEKRIDSSAMGSIHDHSGRLHYQTKRCIKAQLKFAKEYLERTVGCSVVSATIRHAMFEGAMSLHMTLKYLQ